MMPREEIEIVHEAIQAMRRWLAELPEGSQFERPFDVAVREMTQSLGCAERNRDGAALHMRYRTWMRLTVHERDRHTLEAIGDAKAPLTIAEITLRVEERVFPGVRLDGYPATSESHIRSIVQRLHQAGELERHRVAPGTTPGKRNGTRWRYARKAALSGPIADLDRTFYGPEKPRAEGLEP